MRCIICFVFIFVFLIFSAKAQSSIEISYFKSCSKPITRKQLQEVNKNVKCIIGEKIEAQEDIKSFVGIEITKLPNGKNLVSIHSQTDSNQIVFLEENDDLNAKLSLSLKLQSVDKNDAFCFEDNQSFKFKKAQLTDSVHWKSVQLTYKKNFELSKGEYTLLFLVRDTISGLFGVEKIRFEVKKEFLWILLYF